MWESEDMFNEKLDWNKSPKEVDDAWHIKIELIDPDGEMLYWVRRVRELLGFSLGRFLDEDLTCLSHFFFDIKQTSGVLVSFAFHLVFLSRFSDLHAVVESLQAVETLQWENIVTVGSSSNSGNHSTNSGNPLAFYSQHHEEGLFGRHHIVTIGELNGVLIALMARASLSQLDPDAVIRNLTPSFVSSDAVTNKYDAVSTHNMRILHQI
ncbi:hypothetical protein Tco_1036606 [Tanacetum coccineum]